MARSSTPAQHVPLGSLTQPGARDGAACQACGSERVTRIAMALTDGSPVQFTSCHRCEHRTWEESTAVGRAVLPVQRVLDKTRSEVSLEELTTEMAGGQELAELTHELKR